MSYDAIAIANVALASAKRRELSLTPLQLMKLTYIAHGFYLQKYSKELLSDDVQAWQYGPVVPRLYHATKHYGRNPIRDERIPEGIFVNRNVSEDAKALVDAVVSAYGNLSGPASSNLTHKPGSPWSKVWKPGVKNLKIPNSLIKSHYQDAMAKKVLDAA